MSRTETLEFEALVIGAGVHGCSAGVALARKGLKTAIIEQFPLPHSRGSSGGQTRIIRVANYGIPALSVIMEDGYKKWLQLEKLTNTQLIRSFPLVLVGREDRREIDAMFSSVQRSGQSPVWADVQQINANYGSSFPNASLVFEDNSAGVLMADKCLVSLQQVFKSLGGVIIDECHVEEIRVSPLDGKVEMTCKRGSGLSGGSGSGRGHGHFLAKGKYLVVCAGGWTHSILRHLGISLPITPLKVGVFYFRLNNAQRPSMLFVDSSFQEGHFYGLPQMEYPGLVKICFHGGPKMNPDTRDLCDLTSFRSKVESYVNAYMPCVHPKVAVEESCIYSVTPDHEMIIDVHPRYKNIAFATGFSGTGFKIGPSVGEILTDLVMQNTSKIDITAFKLERFADYKVNSSL